MKPPDDRRRRPGSTRTIRIARRSERRARAQSGHVAAAKAGVGSAVTNPLPSRSSPPDAWRRPPAWLAHCGPGYPPVAVCSWSRPQLRTLAARLSSCSLGARIPGAAFQDARRSAASTALESSIAIVVGPTPPRRGRDPAGDLADRLVDVGHHLAAVHRDPRAHHRGTGLHHVGRDDRRPPGRGDEDVGLTGVGPQVGHAGVDDGHRRVRVRLLEREEQRERAADREAHGPRSRRASRRSRPRGSRAAPGCRAACTGAVREPPSRAARGSPGAARRRPSRGRPRAARPPRRGVTGSGSWTMNPSTSGSLVERARSPRGGARRRCRRRARGGARPCRSPRTRPACRARTRGCSGRRPRGSCRAPG